MTLRWFKLESGQASLERRAGYDVWLLALTLLLCTSGAVFVLTSSAVHSWSLYDGDSMAIFWKHVGRLGWGLVCLTVLAFTNYHVLGKAARALWLVAFAGLVAVFFVPQPAGATAQRWLNLLGFSFQPAELAKFALVNYLACRFGSQQDDMFPADVRKTRVGCLVLTAIAFVLILFEPNFSMAFLVLAVAGLLFFLSGVRLKPLFVLGGACAVPLAIVAWLTPYMRLRLSGFLTAIFHPLQAGYHVKQSMVGIGHGGLAGLGLGNSMQKHFFLPEPYKDFIFSIIAEELGLAGSLLLIAIFVWLLARGWKIAKRAPDEYGRFLAAGITTSIGITVVVNVGVALGLLPATGQPLPLVSYGGSSLMMTLGSVGVLLNISRHTQRGESMLAQRWRFK